MKTRLGLTKKSVVVMNCYVLTDYKEITNEERLKYVKPDCAVCFKEDGFVSDDNRRWQSKLRYFVPIDFKFEPERVISPRIFTRIGPNDEVGIVKGSLALFVRQGLLNITGPVDRRADALCELVKLEPCDRRIQGHTYYITDDDDVRSDWNDVGRYVKYLDGGAYLHWIEDSASQGTASWRHWYKCVPIRKAHAKDCAVHKFSSRKNACTCGFGELP